MDLTQSLECCVNHFSSLFLRNNNLKYSGSAINGFRDGIKTNEAYNIIHQNTQLIMTPENINEVFLDLLFSNIT